MKAPKTLATLAGAAALLFVLSAYKCQQTTDFPGFVAEICTDKVDNDSDGLADCADSDCDNACVPEVTIGAVPTAITLDSLTISGTVTNAASVAVSITPSGSVSPAIVTAGTWQARLSGLLARTTYTLRASVADAKGRGDTATASFERKD
ncbi:MAG: hypothetical protein JWP91_527 [Fibrobacteres bacterium]|nr:hypothetical protein [Fibrobacterota bacterium]